MTKTKVQNGIKNLINHYNHFYSVENDSVEHFFGWCRIYDNSKAHSTFIKDIKESFIDIHDVNRYAYNLVFTAGMIASAYEYIKLEYYNDHFLSFYRNSHKSKTLALDYVQAFGVLPSKELLKQFGKRFFRKGSAKLAYMHYQNILHTTESMYEEMKNE